MENNKFDTIVNWLRLKVTLDKYFVLKKRIRLGLFVEGVFSNQPFFNNYTSSILSAPAFEPLSESKTLFQENFRAHTYFGVGLKNIYQLSKNMQLRFEGYLFQPYQNILENDKNPYTNRQNSPFSTGFMGGADFFGR